MPDPRSHATHNLPEPSRAYRWAVLLFISLAMFGNYYVYDSIAPVADLLSRDLGFKDADIGLLYSIYSIAAVVVLLIGGVIIDRAGTKRATFLFAVICTIAGFITVAAPSLTVMACGRLLLGIGAEPMIVAITTALAKWFKGKELSFAFGINLTIARLGSWSADNSPSLAQGLYTNWRDPLWLAAWIGATCIIGAGLYWILESRAEQRHRIGEAGETEKLVWADLYRFDKSYWYVVGLCVVFYSVVFPFRAFAIKFFIEAHGTSREAGGFLNSLLPLSAMIATPLFGFLVDRVGRRSWFMAIGSAVLLPLFLVVAYAPPGDLVSVSLPWTQPVAIPLTLLIVMSVLGIVFSLIPAIMWPSVAYIIEQRRLGSAYSVMTFCQQIGMAAMPWTIGKLNDTFQAGQNNPQGYNPGLWLFTALASLGLVFSFLLWRVETGPNAHGLETIKAGNN
ncbi:MAG: MFS transporter [Candidatus Korobacteraceae bacterium]